MNNKEEKIKELQEKVGKLKKETRTLVGELVVMEVEHELQENFKNMDADIEVSELCITYGFYPESDDEGGSYYYPEGVELEIKCTINGEEFDGDLSELEEHEDEIHDMVYDVLCGHSNNLYDGDIDKIHYKWSDN